MKTIKILSCFLLLLGLPNLVLAQKGNPVGPRHTQFIPIGADESGMDKEQLLRLHFAMTPSDALVLQQTERDELGFIHEKYQQFYEGIRVDGGAVKVHSRDGRVTLLSGGYLDIGNLNVTPALTAEAAFEAAVRHVGALHYYWEQEKSEHLDYEKPAGELVITPDPKTWSAPRLAWKFDIYASAPLYRADVYIDAQTGDFIWENSKIDPTKTAHCQEEMPQVEAVDCDVQEPVASMPEAIAEGGAMGDVAATGISNYNGIVSFTATTASTGFNLRQSVYGNGISTYFLYNNDKYNEATDVWSGGTAFVGDYPAVSAHWGSERTYQYYYQKHNRNSFDGAGALIKSYVHYREYDAATNSYPLYANAFWNGQFMSYADGDGITYLPLVSLDIVGHEITHGVVQHSADLAGVYEAGALNEGFADIFGEAVERYATGGNDWKIATQVHPAGPFRSIINPNSTGNPDTYLGAYWDPLEEVHNNSTVASKWFYILSQGETGSNDFAQSYCVTGIGFDKASKVAYRALTVYMYSGSTYADTREAAIQAAIDLYGADSPEVIATTNAWHAVGVGGPYFKLNCQANVYTSTNADLCGNTVIFANPTWAGVCSTPYVEMVYGQESGSFFPIGETLQYFIAIDNNSGATSSCTFNVVVADLIPPVISCPNDITFNVDPGHCYKLVTFGAPTVNDNCSNATITLQSGQISGMAVYVGDDQHVVWKATDAANNISYCAYNVSVMDNISPLITCYAGVTKTSTETVSACRLRKLFVGGTDNCGYVSPPTVTPSTFTCSNLGINTVTLTANDGHGNTGTCTATVTVVDNTPPSVVCKNASVSLDASGSGSITTASVFQSGSDNCGTVNQQSASPNFFNCGNLGANTVTLTVNDGHGNWGTCTATVTVTDNIAPTAVCKPATVYVNAAGVASLPTASVYQSGSDNCGTVNQQSVSPNTFTCSNLGPNTVTLTVNDGHGNTATCNATVVVADNIAPTAVCKNASVSLDANGSGSITTASVFQSGSDNCGTINQQSVSPNFFNCGNLGANTVTLTLNDGHGNWGTCTATVTVSDNIAPTVVCKPATVFLNEAGTAPVPTSSVFQSGSDNCGTVNQQSVSPASFNCSNLGVNTVTLTANDGHGNTATCNATVTVVDNMAPSVVCKPATVSLDAAGSGSITTASVFQSGSDNCGTVNQQSVSPNTFTCSNLGANTTTLTVNDGHGNTTTCSATITVVDNIAPSVLCKPVTVSLDAAGSGSITTAAVFQSGSDNCGIVNLQSVSPASFTCSNLGTNTATLTVNDGHGNTNTCNATVTVVDNIAPTILCKNVTLNLDASGQAILNVGQINNGSYDNCSITNLAPGQTLFTCANLGDNTVQLNGADQSGNKAGCTATVTVKDLIAPVAKCKNLTANLGMNGSVTVAAGAMDNGSFDNCSFSLALTPAIFNCGNVGANTVTLKATDAGGNTSSCTAILTIKDVTPPTALCKNPTVFLNSAGQGTLTAAEVNNGSNDACGIQSMSINTTQFNCSDISTTYYVILTVKDVNNNTATCTATVSVKDKLAPTAVCNNVTVQLNPQGKVSVSGASLAADSYDNCSVWSYSPVSKQYTTANIGVNNLSVTVKDWSGNAATCVAQVTVLPYGTSLQADDHAGLDDSAENTNGGEADSRAEGRKLEKIDLQLSPNPTRGDVLVQFHLPEEQTFDLRVFDLSGRLLLHRDAAGVEGNNVVELDLSRLAAGLYLIEVRSGQWWSQKRLVLQKD